MASVNEQESGIRPPASAASDATPSVFALNREAVNNGSSVGKTAPITAPSKQEPKARPIRCHHKTCGTSYPDRRKLLAHIEKDHHGVKPFICDWENCDKNFIQKSMLLEHMRIHTGDKPFACSKAGCGSRFTQRSTLIKHMRTHRREGGASSVGTGNGLKRRATVAIAGSLSKQALKRLPESANDSWRLAPSLLKSGPGRPPSGSAVPAAASLADGHHDHDMAAATFPSLPSQGSALHYFGMPMPTSSSQLPSDITSAGTPRQWQTMVHQHQTSTGAPVVRPSQFAMGPSEFSDPRQMMLSQGVSPYGMSPYGFQPYAFGAPHMGYLNDYGYYSGPSGSSSWHHDPSQWVPVQGPSAQWQDLARRSVSLPLNQSASGYVFATQHSVSSYPEVPSAGLGFSQPPTMAAFDARLGTSATSKRTSLSAQVPSFGNREGPDKAQSQPMMPMGMATQQEQQSLQAEPT